MTQNRMTVEKVYYDGILHNASDDIDLNNKALITMLLANDTKIQGGGELLGDPTETALVQFGFHKDLPVNDFLAEHPRVQEVPFDSDRKLMSTVNRYDGQFMVAVKGAPDMLLERVKYVNINGELSEISAEQKKAILASNNEMAKQALRVLAMAYKVVAEPYADPTTDNVEQDLIFAGLVGMIDPERPEAKDAIAEAHRAGIRTIMITGDHQVTAQAIAERLGLVEKAAAMP